jgi:NAD(P)-dependent dehydrogenase (short-subunit alcohol dehydrogenase family)
MTTSTFANSTLLVTGANRGLGQALVDEALARGAGRVYAAARRPVPHPDARVTPLQLDVTDLEQIRAAAELVTALDVLINNAGVSLPDDLSDPLAIHQHLDVNLFGPYEMSKAFEPQLVRSGGRIVNVLSLAALAPVPVTPAYSISKAAALSLSQSLRAQLADRGVGVHVALPGPIDTDMIKGWEIPKTPARDVARAILDGLDAGDEEIFPDPMSAGVAPAWSEGIVKFLERQNAEAVRAMAAGAGG